MALHKIIVAQKTFIEYKDKERFKKVKRLQIHAVEIDKKRGNLEELIENVPCLCVCVCPLKFVYTI